MKAKTTISMLSRRDNRRVITSLDKPIMETVGKLPKHRPRCDRETEILESSKNTKSGLKIPIMNTLPKIEGEGGTAKTPPQTKPLTIGVLALQGAFEAHAKALTALGKVFIMGILSPD